MMVAAAIKPGLVFDNTLPVENPAGIDGVEPVLDVVAQLGGALSPRRRDRSPSSGPCCGSGARAGSSGSSSSGSHSRRCLLPVSIVGMVLTGVGFPEQLALAFVGVAFAGIALAVGVAILRYRLYDIDRVISKTLVYASLTVVLGAAYVGLVLAGQAVFSSFAGGSNLAIAVSTLVVAALFLPVRAAGAAARRPPLLPPPLRRAADARGVRRAAARAGRARRARADLEGVVRETMQPAHVSLWLRAGGATVSRTLSRGLVLALRPPRSRSWSRTSRSRSQAPA